MLKGDLSKSRLKGDLIEKRARVTSTFNNSLVSIDSYIPTDLDANSHNDLLVIINSIYDNIKNISNYDVVSLGDFSVKDDVITMDDDIARKKLEDRIMNSISTGEIKPCYYDKAYSVINSIDYSGEHTFKALDGDYESRLYLSPVIGDSYYNFIEEFVVSCLKEGVEFNIKPSNASFFVSHDGIVIYTKEEYLEKIVDICINIFEENQNLKKGFNSPPVACIPINNYVGVCQSQITQVRGFRDCTYNEYSQKISLQAFSHTIISRFPEIEEILKSLLGSEIVDVFLNYETLMTSQLIDKVTSTFFSNKEIINFICSNVDRDSLYMLQESFYSAMTQFHSWNLYRDHEHLYHPALTDKTLFLEKYNNFTYDKCKN